MAIAIEDIRKRIERRYVGFSPATNSVKPVHIANGLFRSTMGKAFKPKRLYNFVLAQKDNGEIPIHHDLEAVYLELQQVNKLVACDVSRSDLATLRSLMKKIVAADDGVFFGNFDSYTAGSASFMTKDRVAQDGGELVAEWLRRNNSPLVDCLRTSLSDSSDVISLLCAPLLSAEETLYTSEFDFDQLGFLSGAARPSSMQAYNGLLSAAASLSAHLSSHPNKLYRLRLSVLFVSMVLLRHLSLLEATFISDTRAEILPFLIDFTDKKNSMISQASALTYMHYCQSVSRFYEWAFADVLRVQTPLDELRTEGIPQYKNSVSLEAREIWQFALEEPSGSDTQSFLIFGRAMYDMLALQAEGHPIGYLRQLGSRGGFLDPPVHTHPNKRFRLQQDTLEMLIRGAVSPGETVTMPKLLERLWERFGIIIGSRPEDQRSLLTAGIYQFDSVSLADNQRCFAMALENLDFARLLADGVLQVNLEA